MTKKLTNSKSPSLTKIIDLKHDLYTPCAAIAMVANLLADEERDSEKSTILREIAKTADVLMLQINGFADYIENGSIPLTKKNFDLVKLVNDITSSAKLITRSKKLDLTVELDKNLPSFFIGDEHRISRILLNLINNAVKFTHQGFVKITVKLFNCLHEKATLQMTVEDSGIGIAKNKQHLLFKKFYQTKPTKPKATYAGNGLGLAIVKQFVEELHGTIKVVSKLNQGSKFICTLPLQIANTKVKQNISKTTKTFISKEKFNVLLVEDDKLSQYATKKILAKWLPNCRIDIAQNGTQATSLIGHENYHLIFVDFGLPDTDGYRLVNYIRKFNCSDCARGMNPRACPRGRAAPLPLGNPPLLCARSKPRGINLNKKVPIVALTGQDQKIAEKQINKAKVNDFIAKPLTDEKVINIIKRFMPDQCQQLHIIKSAKSLPKITTNSPIIDYAAAKKHLNLGRTALNKLIIILIKELPETEQQLQTAIKNYDLEKITNIAHRLNGTAVYCAAYRLHDAAHQVEQAILQKASKSQLKKKLAKLQTEIDVLLNLKALS